MSCGFEKTGRFLRFSKPSTASLVSTHLSFSRMSACNFLASCSGFPADCFQESVFANSDVARPARSGNTARRTFFRRASLSPPAFSAVPSAFIWNNFNQLIAEYPAGRTRISSLTCPPSSVTNRSWNSSSTASPVPTLLSTDFPFKGPQVELSSDLHNAVIPVCVRKKVRHRGTLPMRAGCQARRAGLQPGLVVQGFACLLLPALLRHRCRPR